MAKNFLASENEIRGIMDGDLGVGVVLKDWYRQRFVARAEDLLDEVINIEIPFSLPRDQFDASIIPGGITSIEDPNIIQAILECLGVDPNADYLFSVMTGKRYRAHDDDPMRLVLLEPKRSRDVMLLASWPKEAPSPINFATDEICESPVLKSASFEDDGRGYCSAAWIIRANSSLGQLLTNEAQQCYLERLQAGIEHFKGYVGSCSKIRDELWARLSAMPHDATGMPPCAPRLTCYDRYMHAEWYDHDGIACDDYYFYTNVGVSSVIDLVNSWIKDGSTFTLVYQI